MKVNGIKTYLLRRKRLLFLILFASSVILTLHWTNNADVLPSWTWNARVTNDMISRTMFSKTPNVTLGVDHASCKAILSGNINSTKKAVDFMKTNFRRSVLPDSYPDITVNCAAYIARRGYVNLTMSAEEEQFPLAFGILVFKHAEQVERLLHAIWRPNNVYCIHIDTKSTYAFRTAIISIARCFDNVSIYPKPVDVRWGTFTVLEPELLCMAEVLKRKQKWRYYINLTGQEFPLKTNYELTRILRAYNWTNDIGGQFKGANLDRWKGKGDPPHKIQPRKGSVHIAASRAFVEYILHNKTAIDFLAWVKKTSVPDETYFASLNFNPHLQIPGSYTGQADDGKYELQWTRHKIWYDQTLCAGKFVRGVCILTIGDLQRLTNSKMMFANKFSYDYQYLGYDCLESWYFDKVSREQQGHLDFNTTIYENRWLVHHHF